MLRLPATPAIARVIAVFLCVLLGGAGDAFAQTVRYFGVWSYNQNAPAQEIPQEDLEGRTLGYWAVAFDEGGGVVSGTYHGSNGAAWLSFWYEKEGGRVYAKLYSGGEPDPETFVNRKSTQLKDRNPNFPEPGGASPSSGG